MKFDDGSYLAIEVVYTHAPDREVHEQYEENMVDIRLKELDEIHDDAVFNRWVQADGVWDLFLAEVEPAQRRARWEARQKVFDVKDEQEHLREVEQRISSCIGKSSDSRMAETKPLSLTLMILMHGLRRKKKTENCKRQIKNAILYYELKFNTELDVDKKIFGRKEDVDAYFAARFKEQIEAEEEEKERRRIVEQEALQAEIQEQISD